jgi:hypothetical protein
LALLVVAVIGVGVFALSRGGGGEGGPTQALHDFADAANNRDCQGMLDASTTNLLNSYFDVPGVDVTPENFLRRCRRFVRSAAWPKMTVEGVRTVSQDAHTAVVEVTKFSDGSSAANRAAVEFTVKYVDGRWKVDSVRLAGDDT